MDKHQGGDENNLEAQVRYLNVLTAVLQSIAALLPVDTDQPMDQWGLWCRVPSFLP